MFQHFLRYVRKENWFQILKNSCRSADTRNLRADLDRRRVRFSIELEQMQTFAVTPQDVEVGSMETTAAGQNPSEAVQNGLTVGCLTIALDTSSKARYLVSAGIGDVLFSVMRMRVSPPQRKFHVQTMESRNCACIGVAKLGE